MHAAVAAREALWDKLWPGQIPPSPVTAVTVPGNHFTLEGHDLEIVEAGHADTDDSTVLHAPDLDLVVAGDVIYNGVHQYLGESAQGGRDAWRRAIDTVRALRPRRVVASHKNKDLDDAANRVIAQTRQYLDDADDELTKNTTPAGFFTAMLEHHPDRRLGATVLWAGTSALYGHTGDAFQDTLAGWFQPLSSTPLVGVANRAALDGRQFLTAQNAAVLLVDPRWASTGTLLPKRGPNGGGLRS
jgi:glyoxylase-like metal-dependent hydrolase (beta-lactamase superfamily II)